MRISASGEKKVLDTSRNLFHQISHCGSSGFDASHPPARITPRRVFRLDSVMYEMNGYEQDALSLAQIYQEMVDAGMLIPVERVTRFTYPSGRKPPARSTPRRDSSKYASTPPGSAAVLMTIGWRAVLGIRSC